MKMRTIFTTVAVTCCLAHAASAETFSADVWADNWFSFNVNGQQVAEDSVSITTERSFNAESFDFAADRPFVIGLTAKDFKENNSGLEYIGTRKQQMGDGGVILQVKDASGNVGTCSFELTVESVLGIESNELNNAISMYPNPAQDRVTISNSSNIQLETAVIYDLNGKMINQIDLSTMQGEQMINISDLASGVYVVQLTSDTSSAVKRLIKK